MDPQWPLQARALQLQSLSWTQMPPQLTQQQMHFRCQKRQHLRQLHPLHPPPPRPQHSLRANQPEVSRSCWPLPCLHPSHHRACRQCIQGSSKRRAACLQRVDRVRPRCACWLAHIQALQDLTQLCIPKKLCMATGLAIAHLSMLHPPSPHYSGHKVCCYLHILPQLLCRIVVNIA